MKKFTLLLTMLLIVLFASAQKKSDLQNQMQQAQEKFSKITQKALFLSKLNERKDLNPESFLKSAATKQKLDSTITKYLNTHDIPSHWDNNLKTEYIYDSEMKNTVWFNKSWNNTKQAWDIDNKIELKYDNNKRVSSMLMYETNGENPALILTDKWLIFYNTAGMMDSSLYYTSNTGGMLWVLNVKQINHYNASKQVISMEQWGLDKDTKVFTKAENVVYTYTSAGKMNTSSTYLFIDGGEILFYKTEYNYDGSGKLTSSEDLEISLSTFVMEKKYRTTYQHNASNDVSVEIYSKWNGASWVELDKDENTYSATNGSDVIFPAFFLMFSYNGPTWTLNKQITLTNNFEMRNGSWLNVDKTIFYYSSGTSTNISEIENALFTVYPNPSSEYVNFNWKGNYENLSLKMYLITGAKVMEQITYSGKPVSISKLENGFYFFKLSNGEQMVYSGKIIKR